MVSYISFSVCNVGTGYGRNATGELAKGAVFIPSASCYGERGGDLFVMPTGTHQTQAEAIEAIGG